MGEEGVKPMSADEGMSPTESPNVLSKTTGVRRVNNLPVYLIGGVLTAFLIVMTLVAAERVKQQNIVPVAKDGVAGNTSMFANEIVGSLKDGMIQANKPAQFMPPPLPDSPPIPITRLSNLDAPPSPPSFQTNSKPNDDLERIRLAKMQQLEEAIKAKTSVQFMAMAKQESPDLVSGYSRNASDETIANLEVVRQEIARNSPQSTDPNKAYQDRMEQLQSGGANGSYGGRQRLFSDDDPSARHQAGYEQFASTDKGDRWKLDSKPETPRTPYELRAGYVIPAIMIYGINSSLPGQIVGQVSQDVYDTATHRWKLIPQGSRLVGTYSSEVEYGQARVLVAWQRIVFPDGKAMDIGTMPGSDGEGYSGFTDQVNNHYARLYGSAFLLSAMTAGFTLSQNQNQTNQGAGYGYQQNASTTLSQALGQQLGQVTGRLMQKNINISPTLEIRPGYRFNVVVTKDMTFSKPYQSFDY
jgi:type IV secretion system protein TrbI